MKSFDKLAMFNIAVKDIDIVKKFYEDILGFKTIAEQKYDNGWHFIKMEVPGGTGINLIKEHKDEPMKAGVMKLYLSTSNIEDAFKDLKAKGVKPTSEIKNDHWDKPLKWFGFTDPDGNQWIVVQFAD